MKGKGKGLSDLKECPLQFPDLKPLDHTRQCPRYCAILQSRDEDDLDLDDLDDLELELEQLLNSANKRLRLLEMEMETLINWQDRKDKKTMGKVQPESIGKRRLSEDSKPTKKFKDAGGGGGKVGQQIGPGRPKSKNIQEKIFAKQESFRGNFTAKLQEYEFTDSPVDVPRLPKNDAPNRFWTSVEPYCADITSEDMKVLEELIKAHDEDSEYYKIPALGKHYSIKWAQEDMLDEQKEGSKINDKKRNLNNNANSNDGNLLLKRADSKDRKKTHFLRMEKLQQNSDPSDDTSPFGPLTQRLVSALFEENIMAPLDDNSLTENSTIKDNNEGNTSSSHRTNFIKSLNISNTSHLERRIKRELEDQGILEEDEKVQENPDDEILSELREKQAELKVLTTHNLQQQKRLLKLAKEELTRQDLRKKLQQVMEAFRKIAAARHKKKTPTKKEKEQAWRALKDRESILKQLDS